MCERGYHGTYFGGGGNKWHDFGLLRCDLIGGYLRFGAAYCCRLQGRDECYVD
jgi:hypothetical protein